MHALGQEAVAADGNSSAVHRCRGTAGRGRRSHKVAANHDLWLNDRLAAEHDVLSTDENRLAGDLVARVLRESKCQQRRQSERATAAARQALTVSM